MFKNVQYFKSTLSKVKSALHTTNSIKMTVFKIPFATRGTFKTVAQIPTIAATGQHELHVDWSPTIDFFYYLIQFAA